MVASTAEQRRTAAALVERHGRTYAEDAGITLADKPSPLWRLLVLSLLLSARISADIAVAAARELSRAGYRTPRSMREATWQDRVDALGRGHYRRYDERTASMLGEVADRVLEEYAGDLRRLHAAAREDASAGASHPVRDGGQAGELAAALSRRLQEFTGIGPTGASIFCREVQGIWPDLAPYVDDRAAGGAERLGLSRAPQRLARLVDAEDLPRLVAGCVRAARDDDVVADVRAACRQSR
ncbi:MAG TPA: endonuclease [Nocardioidaceae bacterium]|jgi:hypothetical protein|nr:endonuclease [Nocardioidaceae bacterium]